MPERKRGRFPSASPVRQPSLAQMNLRKLPAPTATKSTKSIESPSPPHKLPILLTLSVILRLEVIALFWQHYDTLLASSEIYGSNRTTRCIVLVPILTLLFVGGLAETPRQWEGVIQSLLRDGHDASRVRSIFSQPEILFDPEPMNHKLHALFENRFKARLIRSIQEGLQQLGFDPGPIDGLEGWRTRKAILSFQKEQRLSRNGKVSDSLLRNIQETLDPGLKDKPKREGPPVYDVILRNERLNEARDFLNLNRPLLETLAEKYGIPVEVAVGILTVETRVGKYLGERKAFNTLASMSRFVDYELAKPLFSDDTMTSARRAWLRSNSQRVANWAFRELSALLKYTEANRQEPLSLVGSLYGAIGLSQFMPTSALEFGIDGNGDGQVDLFSLEDALYSMANYLRRNGWKTSTRSRRTQARVLYRYNRSRTYVNTVLAVADHLQPNDDP